DLAGIPGELPTIPGVTLHRVDDHTLQAEMARKQDLNTLFAALTDNGITVNSMRTKTNRLEELFVRLVENGRLEPARQEKTA
ncbi:MAG: DUF4162 domain-containing protein, partial [Rhodanobacter sp.]|nr:DUF4162 domain-containing protein [Rhodanobacter sp.]